jgi:polysaccharide biosynthesis/export protein
MMKAKKLIVGLAMAALVSISSATTFAQATDTATTKTRQRFASKNVVPANDPPIVADDKSVEPQKTVTPKKGKTGAADETSENVVSTEAETNPIAAAPATTAAPAEVAPVDPNRHEQAGEEADIVNSYNNFFNTYRLGPEDVISVSVFGQDRYSRAGIVIPPSGRISLALIPGGIFVNGKTVDEVAELIKKRYDEYIIEPQVDVALDKASSYRYSVIGDVAQPGIRLMSRRLTVSEALSEAGGVLQTGDRSKVIVLRKQASGVLSPIAVNVSAIYKGKAPDNTYLVPGDQVIVPGNKLKSFQKIMTFFPILSFAKIFTGGVFPF